MKIEPFDYHVRAHETTLQTALTNLISNALKFKKRDTAPQISIRAERRGEFVRLWIIDNGIGIALKNFAQLFGVFQRLHKEREYSGTGVGLAIVKTAIERMGGRVGIEAEEGWAAVSGSKLSTLKGIRTLGLGMMSGPKKYKVPLAF